MPVAPRQPLPTTTPWTDHVNKWKDCKLCPLGNQRSRIVLAKGRVPCDILFIGEAPGASEDAIGQPFVGPAGKKLDNDEENRPGIIQIALPSHLEWSDRLKMNVWVTDISYAMTNLVCCFPREAKAAGENEPEYEEIKACRPRLVEFVNIARPKLIVCVGRLAAAWVPRDRNMRYTEIDHPAYIVRMPLVQQQMAAQKAVVVLRNAVDDMLNSQQREFTKWGEQHAGQSYYAEAVHGNLPF